MAGRTGIDNGNLCIAIGQHIENTRRQVSCVESTGFTRFKVDLDAPFLLCCPDAVFQYIHVVSRAGDMMAATHIQPFHLRQDIAECRFYGLKRRSQIIGILFTQGMEMETIDE